MSVDRIVALPCVHLERAGQVITPVPRCFATRVGDGFKCSQKILRVDFTFVALAGDQGMAEQDHRSPRLETFPRTPHAKATIVSTGQDVLTVEGVPVASLDCEIRICCEVQPMRSGLSILRCDSQCSLIVDGYPVVRANSK